MSHFAVLVIGGNVAEQLQPYHEFECTGENDQYIQDVDVTEECVKEGLDYHGLENKTVTCESEIDRQEEHKFGYAIVDKDGNLLKAVNRTNPNKKWDWWVAGGRFSNHLILKNGCQSPDFTFKKIDIDFDAMRNRAKESAEKLWDKAFEAHKGEKWNSWEEVKVKYENRDECRVNYNNQPIIKVVREAFEGYWIDGLDQFLTPRDVYVQAKIDDAIITFAVVKDGKWHERGEMGWWACVSNEKDKNDWRREFNDLIDNVPDDTLITIVDCHI